MDDLYCRKFFSQPTQPYQRRYEALRAVFLEGCPQKEVADRFGFQCRSLRQLVHKFRRQGGQASGGSPFFARRGSDGL